MRWGAKKIHDLGGGAKILHDLLLIMVLLLQKSYNKIIKQRYEVMNY
jgi:hypothetical protein